MDHCGSEWVKTSGRYGYNPYYPPFSKGNLPTPPFDKGRWGGILITNAFL